MILSFLFLIGFSCQVFISALILILISRARMTKNGNNLGFGIRSFGIELQFCHLLAGQRNFVSLSLLLYEMGIRRSNQLERVSL